MPDYRIISIGTLAAHPLWNESAEVRTGHATTTLVSIGDDHVLVDPSLPGPILLARLGERTSVSPDDITHVFMTSLDRLHRRALVAFEGSRWLAHEPEIAAARDLLAIERSETRGDREAQDLLDLDASILDRIQPAEDSILPGIDLFPLPGVTPGSCGLVLPLPRLTVLICGDAIPTVEHLEQGKVLPHCASVEQAQASFREAVEIADILILGRDNVAMNPLRRLM
jgi:glyoxylase-like metal-dependent hydrolase (beta-lactamase superfamily II)